MTEEERQYLISRRDELRETAHKHLDQGNARAAFHFYKMSNDYLRAAARIERKDKDQSQDNGHSR